MSCPLDLTLLCIYSVQIKHSNRKLLLLFLLAKPLSWAVFLVWVILRSDFFFGAVTLFNVTISCGLLLHCHSLFNGCDFLLNGFVCAPLFWFCLSFEHSIAYHRKFMNSPWLSLSHCTRKWQPFFCVCSPHSHTNGYKMCRYLHWLWKTNQIGPLNRLCTRTSATVNHTAIVILALFLFSFCFLHLIE